MAKELVDQIGKSKRNLFVIFCFPKGKEHYGELIKMVEQDENFFERDRITKLLEKWQRRSKIKMVKVYCLTEFLVSDEKFAHDFICTQTVTV